MLQDSSRSRFRPGLLGLPGTEGRDIRRARDEASKKRQREVIKVEASIGATFIHPLIFASPTKYGPTGGGLGGIVGDSNAPSCLASAPRQTPYLGRAVGGPRTRCRNDFTSWLPPDGRCIRASDFMGLDFRRIMSRCQLPDGRGPDADACHRSRGDRMATAQTARTAALWNIDPRPRPGVQAPNEAQPVATLRYSLTTPPKGSQTGRLDAEQDATQGCDGMLVGKSSSCPFAFHKERRLWGSTIPPCPRLHAPFTASGNLTRLLQARPLPIPPP